PGIRGPPAQSGRRVVPGAVRVRRPAGGDIRAPHVLRVVVVVVPVAVALHRGDVARVLLADVLARRVLRRVVDRRQTVGRPDVDPFGREAAGGDLGLLLAVREEIVAGPHGVGARRALALDRAGAHHDGRAVPRIRVDADARAGVGVDGQVLRV